MTVGQLRELLIMFDDSAIVFEERDGECRELLGPNVVSQQLVRDDDTGRWRECKAPGFVVFKAWS